MLNWPPAMTPQFQMPVGVLCTGAAGWSGQLAVEGIMSIRRKNSSTQLEPKLPRGWQIVAATLNSKRGQIAIEIRDPKGVGSGAYSMTIDGKCSKAKTVRFPGKGKNRIVVLELGK